MKAAAKICFLYVEPAAQPFLIKELPTFRSHNLELILFRVKRKVKRHRILYVKFPLILYYAKTLKEAP